MAERAIHFLTGIRSEYDILSPVISAVAETSGLRAGVIVTGAHLVSSHGNSVKQIERDGHEIIGRLDTLLASDGLGGRVKGTALQLIGLTDLFARERPDALVVMGDREEPLIGATAAVYHHIPVLHIGGGDHADDGNVDNVVRHATTKLAHLHAVTTERSRAGVLALGEEPWRVRVVGASGLDRLAAVPPISRSELNGALGVDWGERPFIIVLFHPTIVDFTTARAHMRAVLDAADRSGAEIVVMAPNSDPGNAEIAEEIRAFVARVPRAQSHAYLERNVFVNMLRQASVLLGNSSAGIVEAPFLGLPAVNVGLRQLGREHANNVQFVDYEPEAIDAALSRALHDRAYRDEVMRGSTLYGDGTAGARIAKMLDETPFDARLLNKPGPHDIDQVAGD